jgi:hypothetical protein
MKASTVSIEVEAAGGGIQLTTANRISGSAATHANERHNGRLHVDLGMTPT